MGRKFKKIITLPKNVFHKEIFEAFFMGVEGKGYFPSLGLVLETTCNKK